MKKFSIASAVALLISAAPFVLAGNEVGSTFKYVELNQIGDPAKVLEVKEGVSRSLKDGEIRVDVLAAPIHPSNTLQIAGKYLTLPVLPSTPGSEGVGRVVFAIKRTLHLPFAP